MARQRKNTVDYFPHNVHSGRTMFIIESKYGNDGYAVWFKILEMLGASENHYIDCRSSENWEFLLAKVKVEKERVSEILETLSGLDAINTTLWKHKIIWSANFVKNIEDAYKRRSSICMQYEDIMRLLGVKCKQTADIKPQSKVKESKGEYTKQFIAPTLDEVKEYFKSNSYPESLAIKAFNHYELGQWKNRDGKQVKNWKQTMNSVWFDETKKIKETPVKKPFTRDDYFKLFSGETK